MKTKEKILLKAARKVADAIKVFRKHASTTQVCSLSSVLIHLDRALLSGGWDNLREGVKKTKKVILNEKCNGVSFNHLNEKWNGFSFKKRKSILGLPPKNPAARGTLYWAYLTDMEIDKVKSYFAMNDLAVSDICGKGSPNCNEIYSYRGIEIKLTRESAVGWRMLVGKLGGWLDRHSGLYATKKAAKRVAEDEIDEYYHRGINHKTVRTGAPAAPATYRGAAKFETQQTYKGRIILLRPGHGSAALGYEATWQTNRNYDRHYAWSGWKSFCNKATAEFSAKEAIDWLEIRKSSTTSDIQPEVIEETIGTPSTIGTPPSPGTTIWDDPNDRSMYR